MVKNVESRECPKCKLFSGTATQEDMDMIAEYLFSRAAIEVIADMYLESVAQSN